MAVVLWQPPCSIVSEMSRSRANTEANSRSEISVRNEPEIIAPGIQDDSNNNEPINDYNIEPEIEMEEIVWDVCKFSVIVLIKFDCNNFDLVWHPLRLFIIVGRRTEMWRWNQSQRFSRSWF